jgi:hypothetical protein
VSLSIIGATSALVRTAVELADRHPPREGRGRLDGEIWCLRCWAPWPCVPAKHALEVCRAAGLNSPADCRPTHDPLFG